MTGPAVKSLFWISTLFLISMKAYGDTTPSSEKFACPRNNMILDENLRCVTAITMAKCEMKIKKQKFLTSDCEDELEAKKSESSTCPPPATQTQMTCHSESQFSLQGMMVGAIIGIASTLVVGTVSWFLIKWWQGKEKLDRPDDSEVGAPNVTTALTESNDNHETDDQNPGMESPDISSPTGDTSAQDNQDQGEHVNNSDEFSEVELDNETGRAEHGAKATNSGGESWRERAQNQPVSPSR